MKLSKEKQDEIKAAIALALKTGEINDCLLPGFDQEGRWRGVDKWNWQKLLPPTLDPYQLKLPKQRIESQTSNGGRKLNTSYHFDSLCPRPPTPSSTSSSTLKIDYEEISGEIHMIYNLGIYFPNLTRVGGTIDIKNSFKLDAPKLKWVGGSFLFPTVETVGLRSLEYIGMHLSAAEARSVNFPNLREVGGSIVANQCPKFQVPKLRAFGGIITLGPHCQGDFPILAKQLSSRTLKNQKDHPTPFQPFALEELERRKLLEQIVSKTLELG